MSEIKKLNKRVIIVADSMAMPRMEVHYTETWISKLVNTFPHIDFIDKCRRASTSERLVSDGSGTGDKIRSSDLLEYYSPDLVITQIGITDCAPRLFRKGGFFSYLFHLLPNNAIRVIVSLLKKYRGRKLKYAYIPINEFEKNWKQYYDRCKRNKVKVISVLIGLPTKKYLEKSPEILMAIKTYNAILLKLAKQYDNVDFLTPFSQEEVEKFALDEFHVNAEAHEILYNKLVKKVDEFFE